MTLVHPIILEAQLCVKAHLRNPYRGRVYPAEPGKDRDEWREPNPRGKVAGGLPVAGGTKVVDWKGATVRGHQ